MTEAELDRLWLLAIQSSIKDGKTTARHQFAKLIAEAERDAVWNIVFDYAGREDLSDFDQSLLKHLSDLIRARGEK